MKRELIDHKYQIIEELGRGSLAIVYRAKDISLDREVAIKLLDPGLLAREDVEPTLASRFAREAKTTANLQHPNIIDIHEYGEHEGQPFIVMPFLPGASLDKLIRERGALDPAQVLRITEQVGAALDHMHRHGVVHQNIKPSKILFDKDGQAILTDLGGAKVVNESTALTQGRTLGTPYYMPPEQWQGQEMDARSDLYALGVVIYQMLTGRLPFEGNTTSVMQGHLKERPPSPQFMNTSLPRSVDTVLLKALDKDPEKRYQTASQLVIHLKAALADTKKTGVVDKKPSRRFTFVWIVAAALVLLAICGCGGVIFAGMNGSGPAVALFATETLTVTNTPTSTPTATPTSTNTVTPTPTPTKTPTLTLMPTETPIPTNTPTPIPSDTPTYVPSTAIPQQVTIPPTPVPPPSNFQLAYTKFDGTFHNIYIADINGQNEQLIIARAGSPSFSPDNRLYFFGEQGVNQQRDRQNPDPATASILCDFPTISGGIVAIDLMSPLSDICDVQAGLWACFRKGPGDDVCTANNISIFQNLDWKVGTARVVTVAPVNPLVAYDAIPSGDIYRIYFRNAIDFGGPANTEILGEHPSWSLDGQRLAYRSGRENKFGIWVSNRDDTEHDWVVWNSPSHPALSPSFPTWAPNNQTIAFSGLGDQGGQDIFIRPWDKSSPEQNLTNSSSNDTLPVYTPDGRYIIFRSDRGGSWGIWRMNSDGSNPVLIISNAPVGLKWEFSKMDIKSASVPSDAAIVAVPTTIPALTVPPPPPAIPTITMPPGILAGDSSRDFRAGPIAEGEWRYVWAEAYNTGWWLPTVDGGNGCFATGHPDFDFAICQETIRNKSRAEVAVQWKPLLDGDWLVEWDASQFRFFHRGDFIRSEGPGPTLPNSATFTELVRDWDDFFWAAPPDVEFSYHIRIYYLGQQE